MTNLKRAISMLAIGNIATPRLANQAHTLWTCLVKRNSGCPDKHLQIPFMRARQPAGVQVNGGVRPNQSLVFAQC